MKAFISTIVLMMGSLALGAPAKVPEIKIVQGHVEFLAIGKPSAIKIRGKGDKLQGQLQLKGAVLSGQMTFDLSSLSTGIETRDQHMKEKYLETDKFKEAVLTLSSLNLTRDICKEDVQLEKNPFEGTLKLHGVERPLKGEFNLTSKKGQGKAQVRFDLLITEYNIDIPTYMGIKVTDKVENTVDLDWACKE